MGQIAATLGSAWTPEEHEGDDARGSRTVPMCASNSSVLYRGAHLVPDCLRPRRGFGVSSARDREAGRRAEASALSINRARFAAGCARAFGAALTNKHTATVGNLVEYAFTI